MARTDIHREGALVSADYFHVLSYARPRDGWPGMGIDCVRDKAEWRMELFGESVRMVHVSDGKCDGDNCCVTNMRQSGVLFARHGNIGKCTACGAAFDYGDVWCHAMTGEHIHLGHICAKQVGLTADWQPLEAYKDRLKHWRNESKRMVKMHAVKAMAEQKRSLFLSSHPGLESALKCEHYIVRSIAERFELYGTMSDKQAALVLKLHGESTRTEAQKTAHTAHLVTAPTGRVRFRGTVVSVKNQESDYGITTKLLIVVGSKMSGEYKVWVTCPAGLRCERGDVVAMKATLKHGNEPSFAIGSRPTDAMIVNERETA